MLLHLKLPPDFLGGQAGVQPLGAKPGVGLALRCHQRADIVQQIWQAFLSPKPPSAGEGIPTGYPALQLVHPFANSSPVLAQFSLRSPLTTAPQGLHALSHEPPPSSAPEGLSSIDQSHSERVGEFHLRDLQQSLSRRSFYAFLG